MKPKFSFKTFIVFFIISLCPLSFYAFLLGNYLLILPFIRTFCSLVATICGILSVLAPPLVRKRCYLFDTAYYLSHNTVFLLYSTANLRLYVWLNSRTSHWWIRWLTEQWAVSGLERREWNPAQCEFPLFPLRTDECWPCTAQESQFEQFWLVAVPKKYLYLTQDSQQQSIMYKEAKNL